MHSAYSTQGWLVLLAILSLTAAISDLKSRIISNRLCVSISVTSIILVIGNLSLANFILPMFFLSAGILLSKFGYLGGGDSKLFSAYSIAISPENILTTLLLIALVGGCISLFYFFINKVMRKNVIGIPYGISISIGGLYGVVISL